VLTYLLITLIIFFGHSEDLLGTSLLSRPLVLGPLVGLVLGDLHQGIIIGASLELIFMGNIKVGAAIPPDVVTGGVLGTAFAIISGKGTGIALALAIPISILAEMLLSALFVTRSVFNKLFERYAEAGDWRKVERLHVASGFMKPVLMALVGWLALQLGSGAMKAFLDRIPDWVNTGLQVAGNLLPALGFALLMNLLFHKRVAPYFFLGFLLAAYLKLPVIAVGGLGVIIAVLVTSGKAGGDHGSEAGVDETPDTAASGAAGAGGGGIVVIAKPELRRVFWRSMLLEANFNFETMQNTGFAFALLPVLKKLYKTKEAMAAALKRHLQLFNTSTYGCTLILGLAAAMEEQNSHDAEFNDESINAVKTGLMGPLAGVFDSLFWGTLKVIAAGVGTSLALKGNLSGAVLFILLFNVPHLLLRYNLTFIGYTAGTRFLQRLSQNNVMDRLKDGAAILGLMVVGAMPATLMNIHTPLAFTAGNAPGAGGGAAGDGGSSLQGILDQIVPAALPLGLTFLVYYFLKRGVKTTPLLIGLLLLGFIGSIIHVLS
jgi:fructoselysine/glucoselysine PTS system EIID component